MKMVFCQRSCVRDGAILTNNPNYSVNYVLYPQLKDQEKGFTSS